MFVHIRLTLICGVALRQEHHQIAEFLGTEFGYIGQRHMNEAKLAPSASGSEVASNANTGRDTRTTSIASVAPHEHNGS